MTNDQGAALAAPAELFDLRGKVAFVTGAGSGIGRAASQLLGAAGAAVVCADRDDAANRATASLLAERGVEATSVSVDITAAADVAHAITTSARDLGRLDVCANIAGVLPPRIPLVELTEDDFDRVLAVNLKGVLFCATQAARVMIEGGGGAIVNVASAAMDIPAPGLGAYAISKAGVAQLTKSLAVEVAAHGVRVNTIAPGYVPTPMTAAAHTAPDGSLNEASRDRAADEAGRRAPLGLATAEEIARAVLYLASPASAGTTGQVVRPNGGVFMP